MLCWNACHAVDKANHPCERGGHSQGQDDHADAVTGKETLRNQYQAQSIGKSREQIERRIAKKRHEREEALQQRCNQPDHHDLDAETKGIGEGIIALRMDKLGVPEELPCFDIERLKVTKSGFDLDPLK